MASLHSGPSSGPYDTFSLTDTINVRVPLQFLTVYLDSLTPPMAGLRRDTRNPKLAGLALARPHIP